MNDSQVLIPPTPTTNRGRTDHQAGQLRKTWTQIPIPDVKGGGLLLYILQPIALHLVSGMPGDIRQCIANNVGYLHKQLNLHAVAVSSF